uniref:Uncharacterized protein n=1 Tax=Tanacetum cinerariifolium TaxID=118510 RepID=A0A6L2KGB4_TANCI|nr:hypothetical protein [Tanacetum cinerariifolium]
MKFNYDYEDMELDEEAGYTTDDESVMKMEKHMSKQEEKNKEDALIAIIKSIREECTIVHKNKQIRVAELDLKKSSKAVKDTVNNDSFQNNLSSLEELTLGSFLLPFTINNYNSYAMANIDILDSFDVEYEYAKEIKNSYSQRFNEYKRAFDNKVENLSNEYTLRIEKGYLLDDVCEKCEQYHKKIIDSWYDVGYEEEELWLNPFGCAKLTTFIIMRKAYGCEPSVDLFRDGLKPSWEFNQQRLAIIVGGKDDDDLAFLPKDPSLGFSIGSLSSLVNTKLSKDVKEPKVQPAKVTADSGKSPKAGVFVVHPGSVAVRIKEKKCKMRGGSLWPPVKRKLAFGASSSCVVSAKTSASKDVAFILSIFDDDEVNRRARKFLQVIEKMRGEADVIKARERSREEECEEIRVKCEAAMKEFDQNPAIPAPREKISSLTADVKEHKGNLDRMMQESQK